ncbi:MAG TPA: peptide chain release factor N(5)-glutamine methyltransferase [Rhizobiales bacterium]|nr:peptide chain release factor N(5)-glutamine methyltransferase [Hyphomicrobiales bacterium]
MKPEDTLPAGVDAAMRYLLSVFSGAGLATPALDARLLTLAAAQISHEAMIRDPGCELSPAQLGLLQGFARRRLAHEPVSRILGIREFRGHDFEITPHVLDPRADSETLIDAVLEYVPMDASCSILDLGTGSGCLLTSLLRLMPKARGVGVDISPDALVCARGNAVRHEVAQRAYFVCADWYGALGEPFDLVIANPPYISHADMAGLAPDVADYDPALALNGGADGLAAYRAILKDITGILKAGGWLFMEIGAGQETGLKPMMSEAGLARIHSFRDLAGHIRVLGGKLPKN